MKWPKTVIKEIAESQERKAHPDSDITLNDALTISEIEERMLRYVSNFNSIEKRIKKINKLIEAIKNLPIGVLIFERYPMIQFLKKLRHDLKHGHVLSELSPLPAPKPKEKTPGAPEGYPHEKRIVLKYWSQHQERLKKECNNNFSKIAERIKSERPIVDNINNDTLINWLWS